MEESLKIIADQLILQNKPNVISILATIGTFLAVLVALFQERIKNFLVRPKLRIEINNSNPDCHKTVLTYQGLPPIPCYYFRLRILNKGVIGANDVEVTITRLFKKHNNKFIEDTGFLPMNLKWSNVGGESMPHLPQHTFKFIDLGFIAEPKYELPVYGYQDFMNGNNLLKFDFIVDPHTMTHLLPAGDYKLVVQAAASNAKPVEQKMSLCIKKSWTDDENVMLSERVVLRK